MGVNSMTPENPHIQGFSGVGSGLSGSIEKIAVGKNAIYIHEYRGHSFMGFPIAMPGNGPV